MASNKIIKLKIDTDDDRREVANILMCNGYKVWLEKVCTYNAGGMAGSTYDYYLLAEEIKNGG